MSSIPFPFYLFAGLFACGLAVCVWEAWKWRARR